MKPQKLMRKGEELFKQNYAGRTVSDEEWLTFICFEIELSDNGQLLSGRIVPIRDRQSYWREWTGLRPEQTVTIF